MTGTHTAALRRNLLGVLLAGFGSGLLAGPGIPVHISVRASWSDSHDCQYPELKNCQNCRGEGSLTADFDAEVTGDGTLYANPIPGKSRIQFLDRRYCAVDGEGRRTAGRGNAPLVSPMLLKRSITPQEGALMIMTDMPPGGLTQGLSLLQKDYRPTAADMRADAQARIANMKSAGAGKDRTVGVQAPFTMTGDHRGSGWVGVMLLVSVAKERLSGSVSWEEAGLNSGFDLHVVSLKGLSKGANWGRQEFTEADSNRKVRYTVSWSFAPQAEELVFDVKEAYDKWIPAPKPEDLAGIAASAEEDAWKPLEVKVKIRPKQEGGEARKGILRFTLEELSKNPGVCINFPLNAATKTDLRFAKEQPAGITVKGAQASGGSIVDVAETTEKVKEATVILESRDPGAYGKLKVVCEELDLKALHEPTNTYALTIPRDDDGNHIADAWERKQGTSGLKETWDGAEVPGQISKGDGLALYEKYRGAVVLVGNQPTWRRLPPREKVFFVVDEAGDFLPEAWKAASGIRAFRVAPAHCEPGGEASRVLNVNQSRFRNGRKYAVVLTEKATGDADAVARAGGNVDMGETSVGASPREITYCRVFPDHIKGGLRFLMSRLEVAIAHYDEKGGYLSQNFPKWMLEKALAQLRDPAVFQSLVKQGIRWTALHELGHACGLPGHVVGAAESSEGDRRCYMRYSTVDESKQNSVLQTLLQSGASLPVGSDIFCRERFDCFGHLNVKDN